jgi:hypothetical protein
MICIRPYPSNIYDKQNWWGLGVRFFLGKASFQRFDDLSHHFEEDYSIQVPFSERKGLPNRKCLCVCLSVCPINQKAAFLNKRGTAHFYAKLSGVGWSSLTNHNLDSILLEPLLVSQKPIKIEFSKKWSLIRSLMRRVQIWSSFA